MERTDIIIKTIVGIIGGIVSVLTGLFGVMFTVLLGMMALDYITGVLSAIISKEGLSSAKGYRGLFKKTYTMLLIGAILMVEVSILKTNGVITDGVSSAFILIEFVSIIENGNKMGMKLGFLSKLVATVKARVPILEDTESEDKK